MDASSHAQWTENGQARTARWRSERGAPVPGRIVIVDDTTTADAAYGLAGQGTGLLWRGDFHNARQLLVALASRADRPARKAKRGGAVPPPPSLGSPDMAAAFHRERQARAQRAPERGRELSL